VRKTEVPAIKTSPKSDVKETQQIKASRKRDREHSTAVKVYINIIMYIYIERDILIGIYTYMYTHIDIYDSRSQGIKEAGQGIFHYCEGWYRYIYVYTHICEYIYIYIYVCIYVYIRKREREPTTAVKVYLSFMNVHYILGKKNEERLQCIPIIIRSCVQGLGVPLWDV
jgi:hypothetical protein